MLLLALFISSEQLYSELITQQLITDAQKKYNRFAKNRFIAIKKELLEGLNGVNEMKKLNIVNNWVNYVRYNSDKQVYNVNDYWATLYEFIGRDQGDCEDYVIAKYYILKELGVSPRRMKFTYVIYKNRQGKKVSHMVLSYLKVAKPKSKKDILILDNVNKRIFPASERKNIVKVVKMINGDTGAKSKKWKKLEKNMKRKKL